MSREGAPADWDAQIRDLIRQTGMPLSMFAEATGRYTEDVLGWWSGMGKALDFSNMSSLSRFLGVPIEDLMTGKCSTALVRARIFEGPQILPEIYSQHASSFARTSAHIMEYLSLMYGRHFVDRILLALSIHPLFFDNLDNRINLRFFITFLNELSRQGLSDEEIASLACYLFLRIRNTKIGEEFAQASTYEQSYGVLMQEVTSFESNFEYKFEIDHKHVRIIAKPTEAMEFLGNMDPKDYERLFAYRRKAFGWFPLLSRLGPLNFRASKCILRGDGETVYDAEYQSGRLTEHYIGAGLRLV